MALRGKLCQWGLRKRIKRRKVVLVHERKLFSANLGWYVRLEQFWLNPFICWVRLLPLGLFFPIFKLIKWGFCNRGSMGQQPVSSHDHWHNWLQGNWRTKPAVVCSKTSSFVVSSVVNISWSSETLLFSLPFPNQKKTLNYFVKIVMMLSPNCILISIVFFWNLMSRLTAKPVKLLFFSLVDMLPTISLFFWTTHYFSSRKND